MKNNTICRFIGIFAAILIFGIAVDAALAVDYIDNDVGVLSWGGLERSESDPLILEQDSVYTFRMQFSRFVYDLLDIACNPDTQDANDPIEYMTIMRDDSNSSSVGYSAIVTIQTSSSEIGTAKWFLTYRIMDDAEETDAGAWDWNGDLNQFVANTNHTGKYDLYTVTTSAHEIQVVSQNSNTTSNESAISSLGELATSPLEVEQSPFPYVYYVQFNSECAGVKDEIICNSYSDPLQDAEMSITDQEHNSIGWRLEITLQTGTRTGSIFWSIPYINKDGNSYYTTEREIQIVKASQDIIISSDVSGDISSDISGDISGDVPAPSPSPTVIVSDDAIESFGGLSEDLSLSGKSNSVYNFEIQFNELCYQVGEIVYVASSVENPISSMEVVEVERNAVGLCAEIELILSNTTGSVEWWITYYDIYGNFCRTETRKINVEHKVSGGGGGGCDSGFGNWLLMFGIILPILIMRLGNKNY